MDQSSPENSGARPAHGPRLITKLWRAAAIAGVALVVLLAGHFLRGPTGTDDAGGPVAPPADERPAAVPPLPGPVDAVAARDAAADLRKAMAGLVMGAADDPGDFDDPANQDPEERRRFLADRFKLPFDYPRSAAPADLVPDGADVLIVFENPENPATKMVLLKVAKDVGATLSDFYRAYEKKGWRAAESPNPREQTDQGWMVRFTLEDGRGRRDRIIYARPRTGGKETLVAVYESGL